MIATKRKKPLPRVLGLFLDLPIGLRLAMAFFGVFALMAMMAGFSIVTMQQMEQRMARITESNNQQILQVNKMIYSVGLRGVAIRNVALLADADAKKAELEAINESAKMYAEAEKELMQLINRFDATEAEKANLESIKRSETAVVKLMAEAAELGMAGKAEEAAEFMMSKLRPRQARWVTSLQTLSGLQNKVSDEYAQDAAAQYIKSRNILIGFVSISLLLGVALAWLVTRSITSPIGDAVKFARTVATSDLRPVDIPHHKDQAGQLLEALQTMSAHLTTVVRGVREASENIVTGTAEIATGNNDLSMRTEQQASSLEETAASMEEMRQAVRTNAETADQASRVAQDASASATRGGAMVGDVVQTMRQISESSKRIADITGVIDGIAFQTNILALNAAVEAARAGENGRGFAVVASEVRSLAQRSASAAKEIKALIATSVESVRDGTRRVNDAGSAMDGIVQQVRQVATLIGEISHSTREQSQGIDQVGEAISQLDQVTQQNAALVEESAAAASSLQHQAEQLLGAVSVFRIDAHDSLRMAA